MTDPELISVMLNALADRVEREEPSEELRAAVLAAFGSEAEPGSAPDPLRSVDDAIGMMPDEWHISHMTYDEHGWYFEIYHPRGPLTSDQSTTEPRARTAAALRALDWEAELE